MKVMEPGTSLRFSRLVRIRDPLCRPPANLFREEKYLYLLITATLWATISRH